MSDAAKRLGADSFSAYSRRAVREDSARFAAAAAAVFALRSASGFAFAYGSLPATYAGPALSLLSALLAVRLFRSPAAATAGGSVVLADFVIPLLVSLYSLLALADSVAAGSAAASPWPLLVLLPSCFDYGAASLFAAALPAAIGIADAAGAFSASVHTGDALTVASSLLASALVRGVRRRRLALDYRADAERRERERALSTIRDAEVEIAARIQRALLLEKPADLGRHLSLEAITVASNAVDGDFYGFIPYSPSSVDVLVGDVMGKGVPAALLGAAIKGSFFRSSLRLLVDGHGIQPKPADLVSEVHKTVVNELMELESFATLQYARIDASSSRMDFVDCGHTPILHYDSSLGLCWSVKGTDLPLGFSDDSRYEALSLPVAPGDRLLFYSDGITEAPNGEGELFGEDRLAAILAANAALEPSELVRRILNTAMFFSSAIGFRDDVTCVALSVNEDAARVRRTVREFPSDVESLSAIRAFLEGELPGRDETFLARVLLASGEAATNAIRHGSAAGAEEEIPELEAETEGAALFPESDPVPALPAEDIAADSLRVECVGDRLWTAIRIIYRGASFPWHRSPSLPPIESFPSGGLGRSLIAAAADSVLHASGPGDLKLVCIFFEEVASAV